ncbi:MAG TPA: calcineurin-like phosphoesterase family protein [Armatimonadota bacterium]|jgi:hypothetical protein
MNRILLSAGALALLSVPALAQSNATGIVYNDRNANGVRDANEEGIPNVRVSNQRDVTVTDRDGRYKLPVTDDTILFVVKPRNWSTAVDHDQIPRFYYIHKPAGSPKQKFPGVAPTGPLPASVDFPLRRQEEPKRFKALMFGDTQVWDESQIALLSREILDELAETDAAFGMTLGDNTADHPLLFGALARSMATIGIPWHYALGNHDENYDGPDDSHSTETFQAAYGPAYYSFDYGPVHFVTLDTVEWMGKTYRGGIGERQLAWLKNDLARCPKGQLLVLAMHIPLSAIQEKADVFKLLEDRPHVVTVTGHEHWMGHHFLGKEAGFNGKTPLHEFINATTCATFWWGPEDEQGLPIALMSDGAPNGYSIFTFDGDRYSAEYKVARRPADYQMSIFAPDSVASAETGKTEALVNVFAGSEKSIVEMRLDGAGSWSPMEKVSRKDPFLERADTLTPKDTPADKRYPHPMDSPHLWRGLLPANIPAGAHVLNVRTTDMYGQTYNARRVIVVN